MVLKRLSAIVTGWGNIWEIFLPVQPVETGVHCCAAFVVERNPASLDTLTWVALPSLVIAGDL
jgi:hypothetical protein